MHPVNEHVGQARLASTGASNPRARNHNDIRSNSFMGVLTDEKGQQQMSSVSEAAPNPGRIPAAKSALQADVQAVSEPVVIAAQDEDFAGIDLGRSLSSGLTGKGEEVPALLVRLYEQHAFANPFLSIISPGKDSVAAEALERSEANGSIPVPGRPSEPARPSRTDTSPLDTAIGPQSVETVATPYVSEGDDLPEHDWRAPLLGSVAAGSQLWLQRLAKVTTSSDGKATLWIRDYRAPVATLSEVIESFRSYAREQGRDIHRIVMNGVEIWRYNAKQGEV